MAWPRDAYVGQKVMWISNPICICGCGAKNPPKDVPCTVSEVGIIEGIVSIRIKEYSIGPLHKWFVATDFRPVQSTSTGYSLLAKLQDPTNHRDLEDVAPKSPVPENA